jgi:hypothetical protein
MFSLNSRQNEHFKQEKIMDDKDHDNSIIKQPFDFEKSVKRIFENEFLPNIETHEMVASLMIERGITNDQSLKAAIELSAKTRSMNRAIEKNYKEIIQPYEQKKRQLHAKVKELSGRCLKVIDDLDNASLPFLDEKENEREKQEQEAIERQTALAESGEAPVLIPEVVCDVTKIKTASGSVTVKAKLEPLVASLTEAVSNPDFINFKRDALQKMVLVYARACLKLGMLNVPGIVFKERRYTQHYTK